MSYFSPLKIHLTLTMVLEIKQVTQVNLKSSTIIDFFYLALRSDFDDNQPTYKTQDIYNIKADLR